MTGLSTAQEHAPYKPANKIRFVTAAALFDGHDAAINIMRRILMANGAEVIHLGHNRSVDEIVTAALQEDAQGIAVSSYQGGHIEFFKYMIDLLKERGGSRIKVFGGGGGVIVPAEIAELEAYGVTRVFSPEDGQRMGLTGMILEMIEACDIDLSEDAPSTLDALRTGEAGQRHCALARWITALENGRVDAGLKASLDEAAATIRVPTLGITGTGGAGKSSLTDELVRRLRFDQDDALKIAVLAIDPSRRKTGGALLGDRIRMNAIGPWDGQENGRGNRRERVFLRSLATRAGGSEISPALPDAIAACKVAGFDLILVETSGIGQGDAAIAPLVDLCLYVMTPEFGAASQLEKIGMLDFADFVAINKFDRKGAQDALRDVAKQVRRNRDLWSQELEEMPVYGTHASRFNDDGVTALYQGLLPRLAALGLPVETGKDKTGKLRAGKLDAVRVKFSSAGSAILPAERSLYLAEIADAVHGYYTFVAKQAKLARERQQLQESRRMLSAAGKGSDLDDLDELTAEREAQLAPEARKLLEAWPELKAAYAGDQLAVRVRGWESRTELVSTTLSGTRIRKVSLPRFEDQGEILRWLMLENVPGSFPFTAGVFAFKRENEDPTRMFAGEGDPFRTNRRFKLLSEGMSAKRLSTAFDSVRRKRSRWSGIASPARVKVMKVARLVARRQQDGCDQETAEDEEDNHPCPSPQAGVMHPCAFEPRIAVVENHGQNRETAQPVEFRQVGGEPGWSLNGQEID